MQPNSAMATGEVRNPVLDTNLGRLARYGYNRAPDDTIANAAEAWARLKDDFADAGPVPDFGDLPAEARAAAQRYLDIKQEADALLSTCETKHKGILENGLGVNRVEDYAVVRDAYEDKVEEFGAARLAVAQLLADS